VRAQFSDTVFSEKLPARQIVPQEDIGTLSAYLSYLK